MTIRIIFRKIVIYNYNYIEGLISVRTLSCACRATGARQAGDRRATGAAGGRQARAVLTEGGNALLGHNRSHLCHATKHVCTHVYFIFIIDIVTIFIIIITINIIILTK